MRGSPRFASSVVLSLVGHGILVGLSAFWAYGRFRVWDQMVEALEHQAPLISELSFESVERLRADEARGATTAALVHEAERGGAAGTPRPDTGRSGRGGELATEQAQNLADQIDGLTRTDTIVSRYDRSQHSRVESARVRRARENWRATRQPMLLTVLSEGEAQALAARFRRGKASPSLGGVGAGLARPEGSSFGAAWVPLGVGEQPRELGGLELGGKPSSGAGSASGSPGDLAGLERTNGKARPASNEGTPSVPAWREGKPADNVEAEQEVAALRSLLHASAAGGAVGVGQGGTKGGGAPGAGGASGEGSKASALGDGTGSGYDPTTAVRNTYLRSVLGKIHPLWANAFPKWAIAEGLQGTVEIAFTISKNGSLSGAPAITRKSGVSEFDENCRKAVIAAAPFAPLPSELGASFRWTMPFTAKNPAVRPKEKGEGIVTQ